MWLMKGHVDGNMVRNSNPSQISKSNSCEIMRPPSSDSGNFYNLRYSRTVSSVIDTNRGFKPSDFRDPAKKEFLTSLTKKVFKLEMDENNPDLHPINVEKILTPAKGIEMEMAPKKKIFANSAFYAKGLHPTMEEQVELAKKISNSLSDISNKTSRGQTMYVNRKKRSVKWVHEGEGEGKNGQDISNRENPGKKDPLKLVMNPHGQIQDINSLGNQGYNIDSILSPVFCLGIVKDLNSSNGKGAEIFAKRRKRSEKWVVEEKPSIKPFCSDNAFSKSFNETSAPRGDETKKPKDSYLVPQKEKPIYPQEFNAGTVEAVYKKDSTTEHHEDYSVDPALSYCGNGLRISNLTSENNSTYNSSSFNRVLNNSEEESNIYKPTLPSPWNSRNNSEYKYNTLPRTTMLDGYNQGVKAYELNISDRNISHNNFEESSTSPLYSNSNMHIQSVAAPQNKKRINFSSLNNYNTAPRGWTKNEKIYRPITFPRSENDY